VTSCSVVEIYGKSERNCCSILMVYYTRIFTRFVHLEQDRQLYGYRNVEELSCNHCCRVEAIYRMWICSLLNPACTAHAPYYIAICGLSVFHVFHVIWHKPQFSGGGGGELKLKLFFFFEKKLKTKNLQLHEEFTDILSHMYKRLHVKYTSFLSVCTSWFKYDRDYLCINKSQFVPVIFEPPCN
jgi:hypothetical protein